MRVRTLSTVLVAGLLAAAPPAVAATGPAGDGGSAAVAAAAARWGTAPHVVRRSPARTPQVTAIRVAHHPRFDRVVIDLSGPAPGFAVRYVRRLHRDPSGKVVDLLGPASLRLVLKPADGHDPATGRSTISTPRRTAWRLDQVRESAVIGDFEAVFTVGVGLRREAPFRVLTLHAPTRIVVDVRH